MSLSRKPNPPRKRRHKARRPLSKDRRQRLQRHSEVPVTFHNLRTLALTSGAARRICYAHDHGLPADAQYLNDLTEIFESFSH
ncbi:unnamed protein product [marine sediment metagenome]|uniref:Uncharacterized protein n=1 Tax=marine sediment metagenome TaxID=412755 RepID=X1RZZ2_9ZZZZ